MIDDEIMLAVPVKDSYADNIALDLYLDAKKSVHGYLGLYKDKSICAVGKVLKVVKVHKSGGEFIFEFEITANNSAPEVTDDERRRILEFISRAETSDTYRFFVVEKFYNTNYKNIGTIGIMNSKKFSLEKLPTTDAKKIAWHLDGQTWKLTKGEEIICKKKHDVEEIF